MIDFNNFELPYTPARQYDQSVAYFSMEFGIDQALRIYSGGLGYLAGSHMRSAYALKQNLIGIGILWKNGYYDQIRRDNGEMTHQFRQRNYNYLQETGIKFQITVHGAPVWVTAYYLAPEVFGTAPMFLLSTNVPENDFLSRTISNRLYDNNVETKVAQCMLLGKGGAKLLEALNWKPEIYHLNEAHALPAAFHLYEQFGNVEAVRERVVFTTHTPVEAGNEKHDFSLLSRMTFFGNVPDYKVHELTGMQGEVFSHSLAALRLAKVANGVSKIHGHVSRKMWEHYENCAPITHVTNAQNHAFWHDPQLDAALANEDVDALKARKIQLKKELFEIVADQTGKIFDPEVLTVVWARRFAAYKRADLITRDLDAFNALVENSERPIQIIWAGKPYPQDEGAVDLFNHLIHFTKQYPNLAVITGYEMHQSKACKQGSDIWLNNPRVPREASGTSGMTAAMNACVNLSTHDGWVPEFNRQGENGWMIPPVDLTWSQPKQDETDRANLLKLLNEEILPIYYEQPARWWEIVQNSMREVTPYFDSDRMAREYYERVYSATVTEPATYA